MKILLVNTYDIDGGAARAAYRLHEALLASGIDSQMLVQQKSSDDFLVLAPLSRLTKVINKIKPALDSIFIRRYKNRTKTLFSPSWVFSGNVVQKINDLDPDIVHLHWVNGGMLRIEDLLKIKAPIVWTLHDMWAFTGGCHYDELCGAFKKRCGSCKVLNNTNKNDLSRKVYNRKKNTYARIKDLTIVGVSQWLANSARESSLFKNNRVINLPNPLDTSRFKPADIALSRDLWKLPQGKKLILFGAMGSTSDPRKGFHELSSALNGIVRDDIEFVVFGSSRPLNPPELGCKVHYIGTLSDDVSLVTLYSAVDVMIVPSLQEAFGQTASEAMACGTPVVAFGHTGLLDIVDHKKNGYLAKPLDTADMANGIEWVLDNSKYDELCVNARDKVIREFDSNIVAVKYIQLYKEILND